MLELEGETSASGSEQSSSIQQQVQNLVDLVSKNATSMSFQGYGDEFSCCQCSELLHHPVTGPCGYSFCRTCAEKALRCNRCEKKHNRSSFTKLNVVLDGIIERWYPDQYKTRVLATEGDQLLERGSFEAAESKYTAALKQYPRYSYALFRRALARKGRGNWKDALRDLIAAKFRSKFEAALCSGNEEETLAALDVEEKSLTESCLRAIFETTMDTNGAPNLSPAKSAEMMMVDDEEGLAAHNDNDRQNIEEDSAEIPRDSVPEPSTKTNISEIIETIIDEKVADFANIINTKNDTPTTVTKTRVEYKREESKDFDDVDFCCILCTETFYDPVSTPCGHTFCLNCLERCFDHGRSCPTCKTSLKGIYQFQKCYLPMDKSVDAIIRNHLPELSAEREEQRIIETGNLRETLPVFVCTVAFPKVRCYLHVFEPRYRLMIRRATRVHDGMFGITIGSETAPFHGVGTIVNIENVFFYQDGRSLVTSLGTRRFEVEEYSTRDGYNTAKIKYIADEIEENECDINETNRVGKEVYNQAKEWWNNRTTVRFKSSVRHQYGDFPELDDTTGDDGPSWPWWLVATLPLKEETRAYILAKTRLRERLGALHIILRKIQDI